MEQWKDIPEWEGLYQASSMGRVRRVSASRKTPNKYPALGILEPGSKTQRYLTIGLCRDGRGTRHLYRLGRLILTTFSGPPPTPIHQVNHKDGNKHNDAPSNLEWVTPSENVRHTFRELGRVAPKGERHHNAKLTAETVGLARVMAADGHTHHAIAAHVGVSRSAITAVLNGRTWGHVTHA